jgi:hypothetical protein
MIRLAWNRRFSSTSAKSNRARRIPSPLAPPRKLASFQDRRQHLSRKARRTRDEDEYESATGPKLAMWA